MAVLVMAAQGRFQYDAFLFANVGDDSENPDTLAYFDKVAVPFAARAGQTLIELKKMRRDGSVDTLYQNIMGDNKSIPIPARMNGSGAPGNRTCTVDYKIRVIAKWQKMNGATANDPAIL